MPVDAHSLALFFVTSIVAMVIPGPDMLFVLGCGMRGGARAGLLATAGVATSEAVHVAVAAAGLAALFAAAPAAFTVVRVAGAAYLVHLGVQAIRRRGDALDAASSETQGTKKPGGRGVYRHRPPGRRAAQREGPLLWSVSLLHTPKGPVVEPPEIARSDKCASFTPSTSGHFGR